MKLGALEAGGTKMVCAVGDENGQIFERISIPTETPEKTLPAIRDFFLGKDIEALGIGCFGPVDLHKDSPTYGYITTTPKLAWKNCNIVGYLQDALQVPIGFDTDVNGSMLGEATWGCARGLDTAIYITIGTGVGVGVLAGGRLLHGMLHPEAGHLLLNPHPEDHYKGKCPYHGTCLEGMAAGPAIEDRWGRKAYELTDNPKVWEFESYYIAQALAAYILIPAPAPLVESPDHIPRAELTPHWRHWHRVLHGCLDNVDLERVSYYSKLSSFYLLNALIP